MALSSTIKLINTMEWAKKLNFGRNAGLGNSLEPALTSANIILQTLLSPPFSWRWNRVVTGFITTAGQQDYTLFNWDKDFTLTLGYVTVDNFGNCQSLTTAGQSGSSTPTWNNTVGGTTLESVNGGTAIWTNLGPIGVSVSSLYSFAWIENVSVQDTFQGTPKWMQISSKLDLALDSAQGRPVFISAQGDDGDGNITFRLMSVPDAAYPVAITIQQKPPLFTSLNQTWAPVPDEFSHIFSWGFLSLMWLFADDPRFSSANSKFVTQLLGSSSGLSETEKNIFLNIWQAQTGQPIRLVDRLQQGIQASGN